jgi:hypothetical protein
LPEYNCDRNDTDWRQGEAAQTAPAITPAGDRGVHRAPFSRETEFFRKNKYLYNTLQCNDKTPGCIMPANDDVVDANPADDPYCCNADCWYGE